MPSYSSALHFIAACWLAFVSVWLVASVSTKRTVYRESAGERARYWLLLLIAYVLLTQGRRFPYPLSLILIPAMKAPELAFAARGEALSRFRRKYPANGSINPAVRMIPQAGSQQ